MSELQKNVEQIIKNHIEYLTSSRGQKKSAHMSQQNLTLLQELYDQDNKGIIFVNHFGHIEYMNTSFSRFFMLDKYEKDFSNILNIGQLPMEIEVKNHRFHMTYPNGHEIALNMTHQLINFQKTTLLQFVFEDTTSLLDLRAKINQMTARNEYYMEHVHSPMFLINEQGMVKDVSSPYHTFLDQELGTLLNHSIFEYLPFDYANEVVDRIYKVKDSKELHFLYESEANKIIKVYDTTLSSYKDGLILCHITDVSDLNTMSSTIEYLNTYDSLTDFYNRAYYEEKLQQLNDFGYMPLGAYRITIQGLRRLNQSIGYHKTDNLLINLAIDIKAVISQHDIPCRISGDTFLVFLPNYSKKSMDKFVAAMDKHVTKTKEKHPDYPITYDRKYMHFNETTDDFISLVKGLIH